MEKQLNIDAFNIGVGKYLELINFSLSNKYEPEKLGKHIKVLGGYAFKSSYYKNSGVPIIRISDFCNEKIDLSKVKYYDEDQKLARYELNKGDIIIAMTGGTIGKIAIVQEGLGKLYLNQRVGKFIILDENIFFKPFIYWVVRGISNHIKNMGYGGAQPNVSNSQIESLKHSFPDMETQKNIVSFLEDLRNNCVEDKEYFDKKIEGNIILIQKTLRNGLTLGGKNKDNQKQVPKLRQSILQDAIQGKLVPQDPNDEPASELLKKIKAEKEQLIKEKTIKKPKDIAPITDDEIPFALPKGWEWVRLGEIVDMIYGSGLKKEDTIDDGKYPVFGSNGISGYYNDYLTNKRAIIIGRKGSAGALNISELPSWTTDVAYYIEEQLYIDFYFMYYLLKSLKLEDLSKGIKPGLNRNDAYNLVLGLPPLAEQQRIVAKVDELMKFCDGLEKEITEAKENGERLMESVLGEVFR